MLWLQLQAMSIGINRSANRTENFFSLVNGDRFWFFTCQFASLFRCDHPDIEMGASGDAFVLT